MYGNEKSGVKLSNCAEYGPGANSVIDGFIDQALQLIAYAYVVYKHMGRSLENDRGKIHDAPYAQPYEQVAGAV